MVKPRCQVQLTRLWGETARLEQVSACNAPHEQWIHSAIVCELMVRNGVKYQLLFIETVPQHENPAAKNSLGMTGWIGPQSCGPLERSGATWWMARAAQGGDWKATCLEVERLGLEILGTSPIFWCWHANMHLSRGYRMFEPYCQTATWTAAFLIHLHGGIDIDWSDSTGAVLGWKSRASARSAKTRWRQFQAWPENHLL